MANKRRFCFIVAFHTFATLKNPAYLSMSKFLTGCHYNEKEISQHLKKYIVYWPVQMNGNKFATGRILKKPVEVVKGGFELVELKSLLNPAQEKRRPGHSPGSSIQKLVHFLPFIKGFGYFSFHSEATERQLFFSVKFRDLPLSFSNFPSF
jgi:hypothetical protein